MKIFIGLAIVCMLCLLCVPAFARDLEEIGETIIDTLMGDNESCPMLWEGGVAKIWKEPFGQKINLRAELDYRCAIDDLTENNQVMLRTILEF